MKQTNEKEAIEKLREEAEYVLCLEMTYNMQKILLLNKSFIPFIVDAMLEFSAAKDARIEELEGAIKEHIDADGSISLERLYDLIN